jgi:RHS repeat-associated protein
MKFWNSCLGSLICAAATSAAIAQTPVLSTLEAPYAPIQSQVQMAGNTYPSGTVAYGPAGTPLVLSGSNLGDNGVVWFFAYKNGQLDTRTGPFQGVVTLWTANQIFLKVPSNAVSGLVQVVSGDKTSNPLPFVVTGGAYSASCPAGPSPNQLQITTDSLTDGTVSHSYSLQLQAKGGSNSYTWSIYSGSLPAGMSLSSAGVISGTPTSASGPVSFAVQVVDTSTPQQHDEATLSLEVAAQPEAGSNASLYNFSIQNSGGSTEGYDGVGNVIGFTDSVNGGPWTMTYDSLNRLATANGSQDDNLYPNYCWQYDNFGNRAWQTSASTPYSNSSGGANACTAGSGPSWGASYNTSNQISGGQYAYDAAGNIDADSTTGNSYLYDGEGRICAMQQSIDGTTTMTQYIYDAEGHRVAKGSINSWSCDTTSNGFSVTTVYVLDQSGNQMTEMANTSTTQTPSWQWAHTNVFAPGLSATYDADPSGLTAGPLSFHLSDWLGTRRQQTDYAGNPQLNFTGLPYGDGLTTIPVSSTDAADATEHHFTGKERDAESGNDYFLARYYGSSMGRFLSPDSVGGSPDNPQSWNLYSYVLNNPLINTDPDGHACVLQTRTSDTTETVSVASQGDCSGVTVQDGQSATYVNGTVNLSDISAGADGHSIDIGFTSYDGNSSGVQNSSSAPYPDSPNTDPNWGNNAQGYATLGAANTVVKGAAIATGVAFGGLAAAETVPGAVAAVGRWGLQRLAIGASSPALLNLINRLYQAQDEIPGGTAGAVRNEVMTGEYINGGHSIKAAEMITALQNLIKSGQLSGSDQTIAGHIISDLKNSLGR